MDIVELEPCVAIDTHEEIIPPLINEADIEVFEEPPPLAVNVSVRKHAHTRNAAIYLPETEAREYLLMFDLPVVSSSVGTVSGGSLYIPSEPPHNAVISFSNGKTACFYFVKHNWSC